MVRYSFPVRLLHPLLPAGLSRRTLRPQLPLSVAATIYYGGPDVKTGTPARDESAVTFAQQHLLLMGLQGALLFGCATRPSEQAVTEQQNPCSPEQPACPTMPDDSAFVLRGVPNYDQLADNSECYGLTGLVILQPTLGDRRVYLHPGQAVVFPGELAEHGRKKCQSPEWKGDLPRLNVKPLPPIKYEGWPNTHHLQLAELLGPYGERCAGRFLGFSVTWQPPSIVKGKSIPNPHIGIDSRTFNAPIFGTRALGKCPGAENSWAIWVERNVRSYVEWVD